MIRIAGFQIGMYLLIGILFAKASALYDKKHGCKDYDTEDIAMLVLCWPILVVFFIGYLFFESVTEWINK